MTTPKRSAGTLFRPRERLPWPADEPFRILSIDGGGIKGILPAALLARIEEEITGGVPAGRYFDMIAGTSTGERADTTDVIMKKINNTKLMSINGIMSTSVSSSSACLANSSSGASSSS